MKYPVISFCERQECDPAAQECRSCKYFTAYTDNDDLGGYCSYWDIHSSNDCPECCGTGYSCDGGQCDFCHGTGEIDQPL